MQWRRGGCVGEVNKVIVGFWRARKKDDKDEKEYIVRITKVVLS